MLPPIAKSETSTDVWLTPLPIVQALGAFDLDPCGHKLRPLARRTYYVPMDGLGLPWFGRVWCNPPYSTWALWLEKLANHGNGIALMFARTETRAFFDHVWNKADAILFIKRRITFIRPDGGKAMTAPAPSVLIAYGPDNVRALAECGIDGHLVYLVRG